MFPAPNQKEKPLYIKVNPNDNVVVVGNAPGLPAGTVFPCGFELTEDVPQGHKAALVDFQENEPIIRYGEIIGYAVRPIKKGCWIEESLVRMPPPPDLDRLPIGDRIPAPQPPLEGYTFEGYRNEDGTVGIKNILGISTSVQCVAGVLDCAVQRIKEELLPKYPNVDNVVALNHAYGCGVAIDAPQAYIPIRTVQNLALNPNLGGEVMVVGLGCEKLPPEKVGAKSDTIILQEHEGFGKMVEVIMEMAVEKLKKLDKRRRVTCPASDLVIGVQCGGSDALSGITANPAVGYAADLLVRAGATVLFSEVTEVRDAVGQITSRAANEEVGRAIIREMKWYDRYLELGGADRSANTAPGNKKGGLANIVEKSLGSIAKSGSSPLSGVLSPGEKLAKNQKGLIFAATPAGDFVCGTCQLASGINLQIFTTGRGTPYGLAMAPVIKVATINALAEKWHDLIDVNAGRIATGEATIEDVGWELFRLILDVASDRKETWAERWKIYNSLCLFNPAPVT